MKLQTIFLTLVFLAVAITVSAQDRYEMESANMSRAMESLNNGDAAEMLKYLNQEVEAKPENGYAYAWLMFVYNQLEEGGQALNAAAKALKFLPRKDKEYQAFVYVTRGDVYLNLMADSTQALSDYNKAVSFAPDDEKLLFKRLDLLFFLGKYDLAEKDCYRIIELNPSSPFGYMGLGRNAKEQGRHKEAIESYNYVIKLFPDDYSSAYAFRAESYLAMGMIAEAADDVVKALAINGDVKARYLMQQLADSSYLSVSMRLKAQKNQSTDKGVWCFYLGEVAEHTKHYDQAIEWYKESLRIDNDDVTAYRLANVFEEMGNDQLALQYINQAIELDTSDYDYIVKRADIHYHLGNYEATLADMGVVIKEHPTTSYAYYRRGFYLDNMHRYEEAIEDYTTSIVLDPSYAYAYLGRADMYKQLGENSLARKDYQKVLGLDAEPSRGSCAQYAFLHLGQKEKAMEFNARILENNPDDGGVHYDAACLYSLMGDYEQALAYLRMAFQKGYTHISHALIDDDLDPIRNRPEFQQLIQQQQLVQSETVASQAETYANYEDKVAEVPFERKNGVTEVRCSINGLPLYFIFDTGAGNVTISSVEANFMLKNGYLSKKDILGRQNYMTASGEIAEGTVINLNHVEFGGLTLSNVRASVVKSQNAPLLLGQTVLSRLGKIEIDNEKKVLRITYKDKK